MSRLAVAILDWRPYPCKPCKPCKGHSSGARSAEKSLAVDQAFVLHSTPRCDHGWSQSAPSCAPQWLRARGSCSSPHPPGQGKHTHTGCSLHVPHTHLWWSSPVQPPKGRSNISNMKSITMMMVYSHCAVQLLQQPWAGTGLWSWQSTRSICIQCCRQGMGGRIVPAKSGRLSSSPQSLQTELNWGMKVPVAWASRARVIIVWWTSKLDQIMMFRRGWQCERGHAKWWR